MTGKRIALFAALAFLWAASIGRAVETAFLSDSERRDFAAGEKEDVFIDGAGRLMLGPARTVLVEGVDYAWCAAASPAGTVYVGTLPGGKVYRAAAGKSEVFFDTGEAGVFSLALLADGTVIAGTGSKGKVFRISPDGTGELMAQLDADYVFDLAAAPDGKILAATGGSSGRIYRLGGEKPEIVYESPSAHLMALAVAPDGAVYAASGDRGAIYRVAPDGKATVIFSAPQRVVGDVAVGPDGSVYAATAAIAEEKGTAESDMVRSIISEVSARQAEGGPNPAPPAPPAKRAYKVANTLYRIEPGGRVSTLLTIGGGLILTVIAEGDRVLCGTAGNAAGIFTVDPRERRAARIFESKSEEVLSLAPYPAGGFVATFGMPGQAVLFQTDFSRKGEFRGRVIEAKTLSRWGRFSWAGDVPTGTSVAWSVRTGNTPGVDATWTDWQTFEAPGGSALMEQPPSRYIQYRAQLATAAAKSSPSIREVTLAALPMNLPPTVSEISAGKQPPKPPVPPGGPGQQGDAGQQGKGDEPPTLSGTSYVYWKADDPNGDKLVFTLSFREDSMPDFIELEDELTDARFNWDTTGVPDGTYYLRVAASDGPSNTAATALESSRTDGPFIVDNTPPVVAKPSVRKSDGGYTVEAVITDAASSIASAAKSVDGGEWEPLLPEDGIFDSKEEKVVVKADAAGASIVMIKAADLAGNSGAALAVLK